MWGQATVAEVKTMPKRIIPTRVGTRIKIAACRAADRDHPHACGDKRYEFFTTDNAVGSSPRVWGQGSFAVRFAVFVRIIPTRVGTSQIVNRVSF